MFERYDEPESPNEGCLRCMMNPGGRACQRYVVNRNRRMGCGEPESHIGFYGFPLTIYWVYRFSKGISCGFLVFMLGF